MRLFVLAYVSVVAGCTHHPPLSDGRTLAGASVRVETQPGYEERGEVVDTRGGVVIRTERGNFELHEVLKITEIKRLRGALEGFGIGIPVGAVFGAVLGYAGGDHPTPIAYSAGEHAVVDGIVMGGLGGIVGLLVGTVRGSRDVYKISGTPASQTRFIPAGPAGSAVGATVHF